MSMAIFNSYVKLPEGIWGFPQMKILNNGWFIVENPIEMDDLGGTPIPGNLHMLFVLQTPWIIVIFITTNLVK